jgi:hypothetical protein
VALIVPTPLSVVPEAIAKVEAVLPVKASFPPPMVSSQKKYHMFLRAIWHIATHE